MSNHGEDVVNRMQIAPLQDLGLSGEGVNIAVIDYGFLPDLGFDMTVVEDIDFGGLGSARHGRGLHGTAVASCISLIAPHAGVGNLSVVDKKGNSDRSVIEAAIQHCIDVFPKYRIINISLSVEPNGCPNACTLCAAVQRAYEAGIYVVVAAGNTGPKADTLTCPARANWALASVATWPKVIGDYWETHRLHRFWATQITGAFKRSYGTSYSAGYLSGAAALHFESFPRLSADTLRFAVTNTMQNMRQEGLVTLSEVRVREYLLWLKGFSDMDVFFQKRGALFPKLESF